MCRVVIKTSPVAIRQLPFAVPPFAMSLRSLKAGLSKSYSHLNSLHDNGNGDMDANDNLCSSSEWHHEGLDNSKFHHKQQQQHKARPFGALKHKLAKYKAARKASASKISVVLKELEEDWSLNPSGHDNRLLG